MFIYTDVTVEPPMETGTVSEKHWKNDVPAYTGVPPPTERLQWGGHGVQCVCGGGGLWLG